MNKLKQLISGAVKDIYDLRVEVDLSRPDKQFGDFSSNVALQISKQIAKPPREIAQSITDLLIENKNGLVSRIEVAGPGFINIFLTDSVLIEEINNSKLAQINAGKKILVEYSDPNPFKPLHAGHLYSTVVGDVVARLIERSGAEVIRLNYGGDVGLHAAKAMWSIINYLGAEDSSKLAEVSPDQRAEWLGERYVEGSTAYEDDKSAHQEIIEFNKKIYQVHDDQDKQSEFAKIYWECRSWSYDYLKQLYSELGVEEFDRFIPESEVFSSGLKEVEAQLNSGVYQKSDGAVVFKGEDQDLHTRVFINSAGLPTYEAKEIGLMLLKWQDYKFDESIIITANEQSQYMQVVLASLAKFQPEIVKRTTHLTHGFVKLTGGVKMSSRKGSIVSANDIIASAQLAASKQANEVQSSSVLAAVKYAFAKYKMGGDVIYDPEKSIALEGNSGPYIQYAHARATSILSKHSDNHQQPDAKLPAVDLDGSERDLVVKMGEYREVLETATKELAPHLITLYIYELAQEFNRFYENTPVLGSKKEDFRLSLIRKYADILKDGLGLLGIQAPEKM
jgi:arginyl-tRNA synthetase